MPLARPAPNVPGLRDRVLGPQAQLSAAPVPAHGGALVEIRVAIAHEQADAECVVDGDAWERGGGSAARG